MTSKFDKKQFETLFEKYFITDEEYSIKPLDADFKKHVKSNLEKVTFKNSPGDVKKMQQSLKKEFIRNIDKISGELFTDNGMTTVLNNVFEITESVQLSDDQLFNEKIIESLVYELRVSSPFLQRYHILQNKEGGGYFTQSISPTQNNTILVPSRDFDEEFEKYASILSMIPKASEDIELDLYELHRRNKNDKLFKTKYFSKILNTNTYFSDEYEHFEKKMLDYIIVRLIGLENIKNIYTAFSKYISTEIIDKINTNKDKFNMDMELDMALSFEYPKKTPLDVQTELGKAQTKINNFATRIESQYQFEYMFHDYPAENKQQLKTLLENCVKHCKTKYPSTTVKVDGYDTDTQSQEKTILYIGVIDEVYKLLLTKLSADTTLNKYVKQLSPLTQVVQTLSIKEPPSTQPTATQPTAENNYTFESDKFEMLYINVYKGGVILEKEIVVIDMTELQNFYYYVLILFLFDLDLDYQLPEISYQNKTIVTISELKNAIYETGNKIITQENRAIILTQYFECFKTYVFNNDQNNQHIYLGLGGYLISMLCMPYVPLEHFIYATQSEEIFKDLKKFISIDNFASVTIPHVLTNIMNSIGNKNVKFFSQNPYMLGFFTFINNSLSMGTCQDDALLKIMDDDKKGNFYGMEISSYPHLSHWENIKSDANGQITHEFNNNDIIITANNTVMHSASVGTGVVYEGNEKNDELIKRNLTLMKVDIKKIAKHSYQDRANIFLGMTLAHVYRHSIKEGDTTAYSNENRKLNGVAFKKTEQSDSFENAVLNYIRDNILSIPSSFGNILTTESKTQQFDFTKIRAIFNRDFKEIMKAAKPTQIAVAPFGGGNKQNKKANTKSYEKYGKLHNRTVYKRKNSYYIKVKKNNAFVYKRLPYNPLHTNHKKDTVN